MQPCEMGTTCPRCSNRDVAVDIGSRRIRGCKGLGRCEGLGHRCGEGRDAPDFGAGEDPKWRRKRARPAICGGAQPQQRWPYRTFQCEAEPQGRLRVETCHAIDRPLEAASTREGRQRTRWHRRIEGRCRSDPSEAREIAGRRRVYVASGVGSGTTADSATARCRSVPSGDLARSEIGNGLGDRWYSQGGRPGSRR